jgi:LVIVD repeat
VTNTFIGRAGDSSGPGSFAGVLPGPATVAVNNNISGPDGVVSRGNCLYAGDGDSSLKVFDISDPTHPVFAKRISTGGTTRLDEMAITADGKFLLAANNSEDPPYATLFAVDADDGCAAISIAGPSIKVDTSVIPTGKGLSIEQPTWDESTHRFIVSVPTIANNPKNCNYGQNPDVEVLGKPDLDSANQDVGPCSGAVLVIDPNNVENPITDDFVPLVHCGPNGATVGPHGNVMVGCTPGNQPGDLETTIINSKNFNYVDVGNLTGSDEVWYDSGSGRYYTGSSAMPGGAVLGVVDGKTNFLLETIPQSAASHSLAADRLRHKVFVLEVAPFSVVGIGGDKTPVGAGICGTTNGCIGVYTVPGTQGE